MKVLFSKAILLISISICLISNYENVNKTEENIFRIHIMHPGMCLINWVIGKQNNTDFSEFATLAFSFNVYTRLVEKLRVTINKTIFMFVNIRNTLGSTDA